MLPPDFPCGRRPSETFVYFDIGSVLIDLDWDSFFQGMARLAATPGLPEKEAAALFAQPEARRVFRDWATGRLGPWQFSQAALELLGHTPESLARPGAPTVLDVKEVSSLIVGPVRSRCLRLAKRLRAAGVGIGVLSNAVPWHETDIETTLRLRDVFDVVIFSQDVGCEKPQAEIYAAAHAHAERFLSRKHPGRKNGLRARDVFFVDDLPENVRAARAYGFHASLVCLVKESLLAEFEAGRLGEREFAAASRLASNLLFGDEGARRVERLFLPFFESLDPALV